MSSSQISPWRGDEVGMGGKKDGWGGLANKAITLLINSVGQA